MMLTKVMLKVMFVKQKWLIVQMVQTVG